MVQEPSYEDPEEYPWKFNGWSIDEAVEWCREQFGDTVEWIYLDIDDVRPWTHTLTRVFFSDETMAAAFRLRWC